jgi:hypothetical protein
MLIIDYIQDTQHFACILAQQGWVFLKEEVVIKISTFLTGSFFLASLVP